MGFFCYLSAFLLLLAFYCVPTVCGNAELRALMEIKSSLDPKNRYLSSWTAFGDPCSGSFEGVACNEHRKVANISLQGKGLSGTISPSVAELKCLSGLYLHYNSLTGEIPREIANLTELVDLYLNVNNLSGTVPPLIGKMESLQVLELCCNQLNGSIPTSVGALKKLNVIALQRNRLNGTIPASLGSLGMLKRLDVSFNQLYGSVPATLADIPQLEVLDVQNNTLSGVVPAGLRSLAGGFHGENNPGLCGDGFTFLRACTAWDNVNVIQVKPFSPPSNKSVPRSNPVSADVDQPHCNQTHCGGSMKFKRIFVTGGVIAVAFTLIIVGFFTLIHFRRRKQKIGNMNDPSDGQLSVDQAKDSYRIKSSPLINLEYSKEWDLSVFSHDEYGASVDFLIDFKFNLEDVESATQHFSETNLLGKSKFSAVYKGILKDGSVVAIKSINITCCKSEESEFMRGLSLLTCLRHENLVKLRGFCCSKGRGECYLIYEFASKGNLSQYLDYLIYEFASKGNLSQYLDAGDRSNRVLDWNTRTSIINGIARGIRYLHSSETSKPSIVHQNISVEKVLIGDKFEPLISDSGLLKLLADDVVFSALKVSAALGYMAPEYITTGRFTEKSDVYAFGVIILQILSGKTILTTPMRLAAESCRFDGFVDPCLRGKFLESEAAGITRTAVACTHELPDQRPTMEMVMQELRKCDESDDSH